MLSLGGTTDMADGSAPYAAGKYSKVSTASNHGNEAKAENKRTTSPPEADATEGDKPPATEELETYPEKPPSYIWLSILCLFYNFILGIFALVFSMLSDNAWGRDDTKTAKRYGRIALLLCVIGVIVTILVVIIVLPIVQKKEE